jgi:hypothetical protein
MRTVRMLLAVLLVSPVLGGVPARATPVLDLVRCTGTVPLTTLTAPHAKGSGTLSCVGSRTAVESSSPPPTFTAKTKVDVVNTPVTPGVYESSGFLSFTLNRARWGVWFAMPRPSVEGVLPLAVAASSPVAGWDRLGPAGVTTTAYRIQSGSIAATVVCASTCTTVAQVAFAAEWLHQLPV